MSGLHSKLPASPAAKVNDTLAFRRFVLTTAFGASVDPPPWPGCARLGSFRDVATREQVIALIDEGHDYETAARALGIPAGRAFMIATGVPADGGVPPPETVAGKPGPSGSSQHLVNPPAHNPTVNPGVMEWVRGRAARELTRE